MLAIISPRSKNYVITQQLAIWEGQHFGQGCDHIEKIAGVSKKKPARTRAKGEETI
ncbi:hypothetical protein [Cupriavidus pauculus]|uniref:hypothetical protein n=1 Tax=Cupriavidus pauculus TaxID=82633 RepID=UPI0015DFA099|nr:hypothetical protein [Cupriavidus pauculus]